MEMLGNGHIINKQQADGQIDRHKQFPSLKLWLKNFGVRLMAIEGMK